MGIRQKERHSTLTATSTGSSPVCPAMNYRIRRPRKQDGSEGIPASKVKTMPI